MELPYVVIDIIHAFSKLVARPDWSLTNSIVQYCTNTIVCAGLFMTMYEQVDHATYSF